jgi:DNA-damage-inducible protein D
LEKNIEKYTEKVFEDIKHIGENGIEFWCARELMNVLEYKQWRNFVPVLKRAKMLVNPVKMQFLTILRKCAK